MSQINAGKRLATIVSITSRGVGLCVWITMAAILPFCMGTSEVGPWAHQAAPARAGAAASESTS